VTEDFARRIGADGYAPDASRSVALAKSLISRLLETGTIQILLCKFILGMTCRLDQPQS
jgi:hypothetical protein